MINEPQYIWPGADGFKGATLDAYLADGYYRMYHTIFTTNYTEVDVEQGNLPVFWLRTVVNNIRETATARTIRKKGASFKVTYQQAAITAEVEALYSLYYNHIDFSTANSCSACMHDYFTENPFDSWMIEVRDGDLLIAAGFFDVGKNAIAGILNFYHPSYKSYSLGKLLMLLKIDFAIKNELQYYYSGYLCTAIHKFDYKIFPDKTAIELFLPIEKKWTPLQIWDKPKLDSYYQQNFGS